MDIKKYTQNILEENLNLGKNCNCVIYKNIPIDSIIIAHAPDCPSYVKIDKVTEAVRKDLLSRSEVGIKKYGTTLDENKGDERYWLQHMYEEALDFAQYCKRRIMEIDGEIK